MNATKMIKKTLALSGLAAGVTALTMASAPTGAAGFTTIGGSLGQGQRDFRVFNNYTAASANNNTTPHPNFPGALGATMAIWKSHVEWSSVAYAGNGLGDGATSNPVLGSGGANLDFIYQGEANGPGGSNSNIHSELSGCSGGTLAFMQGPISDGWTIKYYQCWSWQDGPNSNGSMDLQGVATHEVGHALGLGHSDAGSSTTMYFAVSGSGVSDRSIATDDANGVQFIYGAKAGNKCEITGISGSKNIGEVLTITGENFSSSNNEVWFTAFDSNGTPNKVTGVPSTGGGTQIQVTIPNGVIDGELMVKRNGSGGDDLSNPWPLNVGQGDANPPFLTGIDPDAGPKGGFNTVTISGLGLDDAVSVRFGETDAISFSVDNDNQITAVTPPHPEPQLAQVDVTVQDVDGESSLPTAYTITFNNPPDIDTVDPAVGPESGGTPVTVSGSSVVGVQSIKFGGVLATDLEIIDANTVECVTPPGTGTVDVRIDISDGILGFNNDTISGGFTYEAGAGGAFVSYGNGSGGAMGVPVFTGTGDLTPGGAGFTLDLANAAASSSATLFVGTAAADLPFKGQSLLVFPLLVQIPLFTAPDGTLSLPAAIPAGTPTSSIFLQYFIQDPTGVKNLTSTNGLEAQIP